MLAAAASFACQPPNAGPLVNLLAAALATPLPCTRSPSLAFAAGFTHQLPQTGPLANMLEAMLPLPLPCPRPLSTVASPSFARQSPPATLLVDAPVAPRPHSGEHSPGRHVSWDCSSPGLPCGPASTAPLPCVCYYRERFGTDARHCQPSCSWLVLQGRPRPLAAQLTGGHLIILWDSISSQDFLVDSGSSYSLLLHQSPALPSSLLLRTADGAPLPTWGIRNVSVCFGDHVFSFPFLLASCARRRFPGCSSPPC